MSNANDEIKQRIDAIQALRCKRDMIAGTLDDQIKRMSMQLEAFMRGAQIDKESTASAVAYFAKTNSVKVQDWNKVFGFIEEHKAHDLLQKRITPSAVQLRIEAGETIPGLTIEPHTEFIVRALSKKAEEKNDG